MNCEGSFTVLVLHCARCFTLEFLNGFCLIHSEKEHYPLISSFSQKAKPLSLKS